MVFFMYLKIKDEFHCDHNTEIFHGRDLIIKILDTLGKCVSLYLFYF